MHKLVVLHYTPDNPEEARRYYRDVHIPIAAQTPNLRSCRFSLAPRAMDGSEPFFCVYEATFDSREKMDEAFRTEIGQRVVADAANFASAGSVVIHYELEEFPIAGGTTGDGRNG